MLNLDFEVVCEDEVEKLLVIRKRIGMKQYEFAREIGISPNYLMAVENYRKPFTENLIERINNYLNQMQMESNL